MKKNAIALLLAFLLCLELFTPALAAEEGDIQYTPPEEVEPQVAALLDGCILDALFSPDSQTVSRSLTMHFASSEEGWEAWRTVLNSLQFSHMKEAGMAAVPHSLEVWRRIVDYTSDDTLAVKAQYLMPGDHRTYEGHMEYGSLSGYYDSWGNTGYRIEITLTFLRSEGDFIDRLKGIAEEIRAASDTVTGQLEQLNDYLIRSFSYDWEGFNTGFFTGSVADFLERGRGVCGSYANTVEYLCLFLGIPCFEFLTDKLPLNEQHAWNCVYVDGAWKMLDVTWNDTEGSPKQYFLVDSIGGRMHDWENYDDPEIVELAKALALELQARLSEAAAEEASTPVTPPEIGVTVGGMPVIWTDALPFIDENSRTMVPLRAVADALGLTVGWDGRAREASFTDGERTIIFPIGSAGAHTGDGETIPMDTAAVIVGDRTYAPIRYLAEYFGRTVGWDGASRTVLID